jgi:hypothetical protein
MLWTGKQVFNVLLRPNSLGDWPLINCHLKAKNCEKESPMCPRDGFVVIRNSEVGLLCFLLCFSGLLVVADPLILTILPLSSLSSVSCCAVTSARTLSVAPNRACFTPSSEVRFSPFFLSFPLRLFH